MPRLPIAWQVMGLAGLSAIVGFLAMLAIQQIGPPPREPPQEITEIARSLDLSRVQGRGVQRSFAEDLPDTSQLAANPRLAEQLAELSGVPVEDLQAFAGPQPFIRRGEVAGNYVVAERLDEGGYMILRNGTDRERNKWLGVIALTATLLVLAFLGLGWLAARRIARPIQQLARTARRARTGAPLVLPDLRGAAPEVREAAMALGDLHDRTLDHARQRVTMLAAMSHDVGTPLARLAFRAEGLEDSQREAAMRDIAIIRQLLADSLTLARSWHGQAELFDMAELCREVLEAETEGGKGDRVTLDAHGPAFVHANHVAVRRMVQNLVDNGLRYGERVHMAISADDTFVRLELTDKGPGFPDMPVAELLRPFVRGEQSRNSASGGSGLGLAIAAQVVELHGGAIELGKAEGGGARVLVTLPAGYHASN